MYRRKAKPVKVKEVEFPADLEKLGLFINENDQLRQIDKPDEGFEYYFHGKSNGYVYHRKQTAPPRERERMNERRREAVDECIRKIVMDRLEQRGMKRLALPLGAAPEEPHLDILVSDNLDTCKRLLILTPDSYGSNLGIWGMRQIQQGSINVGSMINTVDFAFKNGYAIVILSPAETVWDPETRRAMNHLSWKAKDKKTATLDRIKNTIPCNETPEEHVEYVFNRILKDRVPKDVEIDVIACGFTAYAITNFLNENWDEWSDRMFAMAFSESSHAIGGITCEELRKFFMLRVRNYVVHSDLKGEFLLDPRFGCATFSTGTMHAQAIVPECHDLIIEYLRDAHIDPDNCNPDVPIIVGDAPDRDEWIEQMEKREAMGKAGTWDE
ncbi:uncharacterized protein H6S33_009897 [Morchella sextelata]|uniref:uncharacterized protein n=1 Tax=Morchella sextelata TaxID=1174677 RepID=UPI001D041EB4|nr:uncharacterized protein H6S33_009897 [Morchella sextelata]KAH0602229.1 hypothetical protein H6S33_009897 [Morchella sextelata]